MAAAAPRSSNVGRRRADAYISSMIRLHKEPSKETRWAEEGWCRSIWFVDLVSVGEGESDSFSYTKV